MARCSARDLRLTAQQLVGDPTHTELGNASTLLDTIGAYMWRPRVTKIRAFVTLKVSATVARGLLDIHQLRFG